MGCRELDKQGVPKKKRKISHSFKRAGRPPKQSVEQDRKQRKTFKRRQVQRNHIEGLFGQLKTHVSLDRIRWTVSDGVDMQIRLGLLALNLRKAAAFS